MGDGTQSSFCRHRDSKRKAPPANGAALAIRGAITRRTMHTVVKGGNRLYGRECECYIRLHARTPSWDPLCATGHASQRKADTTPSQTSSRTGILGNEPVSTGTEFQLAKYFLLSEACFKLGVLTSSIEFVATLVKGHIGSLNHATCGLLGLRALCKSANFEWV